MKMKITLAVALAAATLGATAASAGDWTPKEILLGKQYNGNVTAIRVDRGGFERHTYPMQARYPTGNSLGRAQGEVKEDPSLVAALEARGIAPHNVLWVQTAFNGGKVVYYR
ncbi:hypothetical protein ACSV9I_17160 [Rhizobium sp. G187]|uniref:hypothetical protein n=1 Tax=unclassified Rhizobium TaxID=2613769 RepID=UPI000A8139B2|nr:hypothetical protein [Rhizobium sp. AAP43]